MEILRDTDSNSKLVGKTIINQLYPLLNHVKNRVVAGHGEQALSSSEREQLLSVYATLAGQLDSLWTSIAPETALALVVPHGLAATAAAPVPALLSTYISPQDQDCIYVAQGPNSGDLTDEEEAALENMLKKQTADVEGAIEELTERMDSWRAKCKQRRAEAQAAATTAAAKDRGNGTTGNSSGTGDGRKRKRE